MDKFMDTELILDLEVSNFMKFHKRTNFLFPSISHQSIYI